MEPLPPPYTQGTLQRIPDGFLALSSTKRAEQTCKQTSLTTPLNFHNLIPTYLTDKRKQEKLVLAILKQYHITYTQEKLFEK